MRIRLLMRLMVLGTAILAILPLGVGPSWAKVPNYAPNEIRSLSSQVPPLSAFPGSDGVVWRLHRQYRMLHDGSVEVSASMVALLGERIPPMLRDVFFPIPEGGGVEVKPLRWYNPLTWREEGVSVPERRRIGPLEGVFLEVPSDAVGRVVVLSWSRRIPVKASLGALVEFGMPLPVWDESLSVEVPAGKPLLFSSQGLGDPERESQGGIDLYTWRAINEPPQAVGDGMPFISSGSRRPYVVFGTAVGEDLWAKKLSSMEGELLSQAGPSKLPKSLVGKWEAIGSSQSAGPLIFSDGVGLIALDEGRTKALKESLESQGWRVKVLWQPRIDLPRDLPLAEGVWLRPVLRASKQGEGDVLMFPGQSLPFGDVPPELYGSTLCSKGDGGGLFTLSVPFPSASQSRLVAELSGVVDSQGNMSGSLELSLGGVWRGLSAGNGGGLSWIAMGPLRVDQEVKVRYAAGGVYLSVPVSGRLGTVSGSGMLLTVPSLYPRVLDDLLKSSSGPRVSFPFVLEQRVDLAIPSGLQLLVEPMLRKSGAVSQRFSLSSRKGRLGFSSSLTVRDIKGGASSPLAEDFIYFVRGLSEGILLRGK